MLEAKKLFKKYGEHTALHGIDLSIRPGDVYALLGPNGAGKTTTINSFLGFIAPDGGSVSVAGADVAADPESARRQLAYIPEQVNLYGYFSGLENLAYFAELNGHRYGDHELRAFLSEAGLQEEAHGRRVGGYSKGMRQKVGIAIALAKSARGLLLDEPTSGLDPAASFEFSGLLKHLAARGVAILMATHDLFRAQEVATRVGVMAGGRLLHELSGTELRANELEQVYLRAVKN
jgi:ABC-2 type transport system ATP-binding protein